MIRLAYYSDATGTPSAAELRDILTVSQRNNPAQSVGGLLMYHDKAYLQILEGWADDVYGLFRRIKEDPRHRAVTRIFDLDVTVPMFPQWGMAIAQPRDLGPTPLDNLLTLQKIADQLPIYAKNDVRASSLIRRYLSTFDEFDDLVNASTRMLGGFGRTVHLS